MRKRTRARFEGERVYKIGKVRFFGGDARALLHDIDPMELIKEILIKRAQDNKFTGEVSVFRTIDGHKLKFTQTQTRSLLLHVEEV